MISLAELQPVAMSWPWTLAYLILAMSVLTGAAWLGSELYRWSCSYRACRWIRSSEERQERRLKLIASSERPRQWL